MRRGAVSPTARMFSAMDMMRWARYVTDGKPDDVLRHRLDYWFQGPQFDRPGIDWGNKKRKTGRMTRWDLEVVRDWIDGQLTKGARPDEGEVSCLVGTVRELLAEVEALRAERKGMRKWRPG